MQCGFNFLWNVDDCSNAMQCNAMSMTAPMQCNAMQCRWLLSADTDGQHTWTDHTLRDARNGKCYSKLLQNYFLHEQCIPLRPWQLLFLANLGRNVTMHLRTTPRGSYFAIFLHRPIFGSIFLHAIHGWVILCVHWKLLPIRSKQVWKKCPKLFEKYILLLCEQCFVSLNWGRDIKICLKRDI